MIFIDTSAFLAIILKNDVNHEKARVIWDALLDSENALISRGKSDPYPPSISF